MALIFGGTSGAGLSQLIPPSQDVVRPDPWTGTQAKEAHQGIQRQLDSMHKEIGDVRALLHAHQIRGEAGFQKLEDLRRRIARIERDSDVR